MNTWKVKGFIATFITILLTGCASLSEERTAGTQNTRASQNQVRPAQTISQIGSTNTSIDSREEIIEQGSGQFFNPNPQSFQTSSIDNNIEIDFEGSSLTEFIAVILGDLLGLNYIIDPSISGTVTLHTASAVNQDELLFLVDQVLSLNNASLTQIGDLYRVLPANQTLNNITVPSAQPPANSAGVAIQLLPLEYISAVEMQKLLTPVVADSSSISIDSSRNLIIASGTSAELAAIRDTINIFDVDWLRGMSLGLYPLDYVDPQTLQTELIDILSTENDEADTLLSGLARLIPLPRLSSLLVVTPTTSALREVEVWIRRLDQPTETAGKRIFVYPVQNAKAVELADVLGQIFQAGNNASNQSNSSIALASGLTPAQISTGSSAASDTGDQNSSASLPGLGDIQIIADDVRNSLVILADSQSYQMVESAIKQLDVVPLQVMIEASIIEVSLRDDLSYGVEWFFKNSINNGEFDGFGTQDLGGAGITALAPGFSYTVIDSASDVRVALNMLASASEVNVLSSPSLMVLDNQTAMINVGDEIPVPTRQSISNIDPTSPTVNEIAFRQTGITLTVTPRVNSSGLVTMDISQQVSSAATTTTSNLDAPTIQNRQIETVVAVNSGETIMLGGLMLEQQAISESGVPILSKIPLLGNLFSQNNNESSRTELLILITPRVVRNQLDAQSITEDYRNGMQLLPNIPLSEADDAA